MEVENIISAIRIAENKSYLDASRVFYNEIGMDVLSHPSFAECFVDPHAFYSGLMPNTSIGDTAMMELAFQDYLSSWSDYRHLEYMKYLEEWDACFRSRAPRPNWRTGIFELEFDGNMEVEENTDGSEIKVPRKNAPKGDAGAEDDDDDSEDLGEEEGEEEDGEDADYKGDGSDEGEEGEDEGGDEEGEDSDDNEEEVDEEEEEEEGAESDEEDEKSKTKEDEKIVGAAGKGDSDKAPVSEEPVSSSSGNTLKKKASKEEADGSPSGKKRRIK